MTHEEHLDVIRFACEKVKGRIPVVAGTGSNCTETAVYLSQEAERLGADGVLVVSPYYNKATQKGLYRHFSAVAESIKIPVILYNIPGRTGVNIAPETIAKLCENVENPLVPLSICSSGQSNPQFPHTYPQSFQSITACPPPVSTNSRNFLSKVPLLTHLSTSFLHLQPLIPEPFYSSRNPVNGNGLIFHPLPGEQPLIGAREETVVQKHYDSHILRRADHPPCRLQNLVHSRIPVGIIESVFSHPVKIPL